MRRRAPGAAEDGGRAPARQRRAVRRVPERRHRLELGRRADGRGLPPSRSRPSRSASASGASTSRSTDDEWPHLRHGSPRGRLHGIGDARALPAVVDVLDEPLADASILPTYLLSRFTREVVRLLSVAMEATSSWRDIPPSPLTGRRGSIGVPSPVHDRIILPLAERLPVSTANFSFDFKVKRFLRAARRPTAERHATWLGSFTPSEQPG